MPDSFVPPYALNTRLTVMSLAAVVAQLFAVPWLLLPGSPYLALTVVIVLSLINPLSRALMHEAIHGRLTRSRDWNDRLGRALAVTSGTAFDPVRFGHLTHHRFARHELDRPDVIGPGASRLVAGFNYYAGLLGGIALRETLTSVLLLLPRGILLLIVDYGMPKDDALRVLRGAIRRNLDRRLRRARVDLAFVVLIYGMAFYLYGVFWPVLAAGIALRALIVSLQDNAAHYGTPATLRAPAHNTSLPRFARTFMLNNNLHGVHHDRPDLPWDALPTATAPQESLKLGYVALVFRQFRGPRRAFAAEALRPTGAAAQD